MVARVLIAGLVLVGCEKTSEKYCGLHPDDIEHCGYTDAGIDARPTCTDSTQCPTTAPFCETSSGMCVGCLLDTDCTDTAAPQCDPVTFSCVGCSAHSECASDVCLPGGMCADDSTVAYVDPAGTDTTTCSKATPCALVSDAIATDKPTIKITGAVVDTDVSFDGITRTVLADPGTTLTRNTNGVVIDVSGGSSVTIYDLSVIGHDDACVKIAGSTVRLYRSMFTGSNHADRPAINASSASTLTMSRCKVESNIGGGVLTDATTTFNITNCFLTRNGDDSSTIGGARLLATDPGERKFTLNTVVDNRTKLGGGIAGGIACYASGLAIPDNLIVRNYSAASTGLGANELAATAHCDSNGSQLDTTVEPYSFVMPDGTGPWDYHVGPGSMAIDRATASDVSIDVDGQPRPQGTAFDFGADEFK